MPNAIRPTLPNLGRYAGSLGTPAQTADAATLVNEVNSKWSQLAQRGVSRTDGAWLVQLANHPAADASVWKAILTRLETATVTPAAQAAIAQIKTALEAKVGGDGFNTTPVAPPQGGGGQVGVIPGVGGPDLVTGAAPPEFAKPVFGARLAAVWPAELKHTIHTLNSLDLGKLQAEQGDRGGLGPLTNIADVFRHPKLLNTAVLFSDAQGQPKPGLEALAAALQRPFAVGADRHLNPLPELNGAKSQRIMFVGPSQASMDDLKTTLAYFTSRGVAIDKNMAHIADAFGGPVQTALQGEHGPQDGVTHGGLMEVLNIDPEAGPMSVEDIKANLSKLKIGRFDKPADYGDPTAGGDPTYWFHMVAFDPSKVEFQSATKPGQKEFNGWLHAAQLWRVIDICTVGFASDYPVAALSNYKNNPVELTGADKARPMLDKMALAFNAKAPGSAEAAEELRWYAEYCEEGKTATRSHGLNAPINQKSVDRGAISEQSLAVFKQMETVYASAYLKPDGTVDRAAMFEKPELGYQKLLADGLITERAYGDLEKTGYLGKPFVLSDPNLDSWMAYQPKGVEATPGVDGYGLPYKPISLVGLVRMVLSSNIPRQEIAGNFAEQLKGVQAGTNEAAKAQLNAVLGQAGAPNVEVFSGVAAAGFQVNVLQALKDTVFEKLRFDELSPEDRTQVESFWNRALEIVGNPGMALNREALFGALEKLDAEMSELKMSVDGSTKRHFLYVPPNLIPHLARGMAGFQSVGMEHLGVGVNESFKAPGAQPGL